MFLEVEEGGQDLDEEAVKVYLIRFIADSAIATDDCHPLRSHSIHQNAANCMTIRFRYIAQPRGVRKTYAHAHVMMFDALPVGRTACRVRR